ncbi:MAG: hypothetical protein RhofKO_34630 [Rhodothermales bacterium]
MEASDACEKDVDLFAYSAPSMNDWKPNKFSLLLILGFLAFASCNEDVSEDPMTALQKRIEFALESEIGRMWTEATEVAQTLKKRPLLTDQQERQMRRYLSKAHMERAQRLGIVPGAGEDQIDDLLADGRLVEMEEDTTYWIVRDLDYSVPYVVPSKKAMLVELGERFHAQLAEEGLPPIRFEISSLLRTAETQAALRRVNGNAARGTSTHEYGTTIDIAYNSFTAPVEPYAALIGEDDRWLEPYLRQVATAVTEATVAKYSREMQAILGEVLIEMQNEGKVMITLERRQPVYHITVADDYGGVRWGQAGVVNRWTLSQGLP